MNTDAVHTELDARVDAALERGDNARDNIRRLLVWEVVVCARDDGHLKDILTSMRRDRTRARALIVTRLDEILEVPRRRPWWSWCGRRDGRRVYDGFPDAQLMDALATVLLEK